MLLLNWTRHRAMRRNSPMRERQVSALINARRSPTGSAPIARATVMNSTTSGRRSPPSYFATNDRGRARRGTCVLRLLPIQFEMVSASVASARSFES